MGSLTLSSLNFNKIASINEPGMIMKLAAKMKEKKSNRNLRHLMLA
jgi:3-keto-5-aminohexanoate cleavage enzyme